MDMRLRFITPTGALLVAATLLSAQSVRREAAGAPVSRIAFGSCAEQDKPQPVWKAVLAARPEVFLSLGDIVYVNHGSEDRAARLAAYRKIASLPDFRRLRATARFLATWDDGELGVNDGGADFPALEEFRQDFLDFLGEPRDSPRRKPASGVYTAQVFGPPGRRVQIILLDTRSFRSPLRRGNFSEDEGRYVADSDSAKTMLGQAQWAWLETRLREPAELRLLVSSIQVLSEEHHWEKWANFPHERRRLLELIRDTRARGVILLSGDRHLAELSALSAAESPAGYLLFDLTSSGLNNARIRQAPHEPNRHRAAVVNWSNNFGLVAVDWRRADPRISLQIRNEQGDILIQRILILSLLRPN
jgi:alkaline phosphatase D